MVLCMVSATLLAMTFQPERAQVPVVQPVKHVQLAKAHSPSAQPMAPLPTTTTPTAYLITT